MERQSDNIADGFRRERDTLRQIDKARDAIKHKYRLLKAGKQSMERALGETFKPIVKPLEQLVDASTRESKNLMEPQEDASFETAYESMDDKWTRPKNPVHKYLNLLERNRKKYLDMTYGVRQLADGTLMVGDSPISFDDEYVEVGDSKFPSSIGLLELLFRKEPDASLISPEDTNNYGKILQMTNAHKKNYSSSEVIRRQNNSKFKNYVAPLASPIRGKGLPRYKIARKDTRMDYVYWDDPNELVDRLRLLLAEQTAGNPSHTNEIFSIIEELREAGILATT